MPQTAAGTVRDVRYEPDERPPLALALGLGFQFAMLAVAGIVLTPAIVVRAAGGSDGFLSWATFADGGPGLLATLVTVSALFQFALSARLSLLRRVLTPTVCGTVIMLIPVTLMPIMFGLLTDVPESAAPPRSLSRSSPRCARRASGASGRRSSASAPAVRSPARSASMRSSVSPRRTG